MTFTILQLVKLPQTKEYGPASESGAKTNFISEQSLPNY